jgi:hypothetical protein
MKSKTILNTMMAIGIALMLNGCAGKDGAPGATGPQGAQGNANVTTQTWTVSSWGNNGSNYYASFSDPNLTSAIQSSGTVEVFFTPDGGTTWTALPFTQYMGSGSPNYYWEYKTQVGVVYVLWTYNGAGLGSDPNAIYGVTSEFKDVCIAAAIMKQHPNTNWKDYSQVQSIISSQKANQ